MHECAQHGGVMCMIRPACGTACILPSWGEVNAAYGEGMITDDPFMDRFVIMPHWEAFT